MSEHQCIAFRAIDGPVSEKNLEFMRRQSSRAQITPWAFDNEYHYGDFGGDAAEMLRRGYDFHLHYANFGVGTLMIRLPHALPDPKAADPYFDDDALSLIEDKDGPGAILCIQPCYEPGELDEIWDIDAVVDRLLPLRAELLDGDLRPLYLARLAIACDSNHDPDEETEGPVPAGLDQLTDAQRALAGFYGLSDALIAAAALKSPTLPPRRDSERAHAAWLKAQPAAKKDAWLLRLMAESQAAVRREILGEFQQSQDVPSWPTVCPNRSLVELRAAADEIERETKRNNAAKAAKARARKLAGMAANPAPTLRETERLVKLRSTDAYQETAELLADLREALAGTAQADLPAEQARKLKASHPTLNRLTSALRRKGLL